MYKGIDNVSRITEMFSFSQALEANDKMQIYPLCYFTYY